MSSELTLPTDNFNIQPSAFTDKDIDKLAEASYLPRVSLMDKGSPLVVDGRTQQGTYSLIRSNTSFEDLTKQFEAYVVARRPKAMKFSQDGVFSTFDPNSKDFQDIVGAAEVQNSKCSFGIEFLVWVRTVRTWATYFASSKTARRASQDLSRILTEWRQSVESKKMDANVQVIEPRVKFACSLKSGNGYKWWGPDFSRCSTPFSEVPSVEEMAEQVTKFLNPPTDDREKVEGEARDR